MYRLFVDLDGVLVDFERGVLDVTGMNVDEIPVKRMWRALAKHPDFYNTLSWLPDGKQLWNYVKKLSPTVLTGLPWGNWAKPQKVAWCRRELGSDVPVITCFSREKARRARAVTAPAHTPVLIDDRASLSGSWEGMGGIFIHHVSAEQSILQLKALGL